jgi:hypothetical protein
VGKFKLLGGPTVYTVGQLYSKVSDIDHLDWEPDYILLPEIICNQR